MGLFLGIDGGQSSTIALIAEDDGRVIGSGKSGPCSSFTSIEESIALACESAELAAAEVRFSAACVGLSGGPGERTERLQRLLRTKYLSVVTDGEIALTGAFLGEPGTVVIAGTGSICFSRGAAGNLKRRGGWGFVYGDEGGAFDISRQAARAALRFEEGWGAGTELHGVLLRATQSANANAMLHSFYSDRWPRARVAELAVLVDVAAASGDSIAVAILNQAAQSLAMLALDIQEGTSSVSYTGGVFRSCLVRERFRLLVELGGLSCVAPELNPAAGALLEAFGLAGNEVVLSEIPDLK